MSGSNCVFTLELLLEAGEWGPGMLLDTPQCPPGQPLTESDLAPMSKARGEKLS